MGIVKQQLPRRRRPRRSGVADRALQALPRPRWTVVPDIENW